MQLSSRILSMMAVAMVMALPLPLAAQQSRAISLEDALRVAESSSEAVQVARAGVIRAHGQKKQAFSQYLPQLNGSLQYTRTLETQFSALAGSGPTPGPGVPPVPPSDTTSFFQPCGRYLAGSGATDAQRLAGLEQFARCSGSAGIDFSRVGFGAANQYTAGLTGSVNLYTGGRVTAQNRAADAGRRSADIEVTAQRAQLVLDVTSSYFDAALSERLVAIAESSLVQTERTFGQTRLARQVGNQSEFELLRAQVTRDNQRPQVIQARTNRDIAFLRLKQLLNIPLGESVQLTTDIGDGDAKPAVLLASMPGARIGTVPDTVVDSRAPVRQLEAALQVQEAQLRITQSERLPAITLSSQYQRLAFPRSGLPNLGNTLTNWSVSVGATMPLFTGGRLTGDAMVARAAVAEARARLDQTREFAALDTRQSLAQLEQAEAELSASAGTTEQATKAYSIAEVRFSEGISTQIELTESRLLLQQALANRATAARNLQVARMRMALIRDLPLGTTGGMQGGSQVQGGAPNQATPPPPRPQGAVASTGTGQ